MPTEEEIAATKAAEEAAAKAKADGEGGDGKGDLKAGPTPNFDPTAISKAVQEGLAQFVKDNPAEPTPDPQINAPRPQPIESNPLEDAINPILKPHLDRLSISAEGAADLSMFYIKHPEAKDYMEDIEKAFGDSVKQGTPTVREYLWDAYRGRNFDKFVTKRDEANAEKLKLAKQNEDLGGAGPAGQQGKVNVDYTTPVADVDKALDGREF